MGIIYSLWKRLLGSRGPHGIGNRPKYNGPSCGYPKEEWMVWVGDGISCAGPNLIGCSVDYHGKKGRVVDANLLQILVRWE